MTVLITLLAFLLGAVLLGLAQWLYSVAKRQYIRRQRRRGRTIRIVVLIDRKRRAYRRTPFWRAVFKVPDQDFRHRVDVRYLSIADELNRNRNPAPLMFTTDAADVIVVNWDVMNGDPAFGSDRTYAFIEHYRPDMAKWLREGGVLVLEAQGASWGAIQKPYDCVTGPLRDSQVKVHEGLWCVGDTVTLNAKHKENPLAKGLTADDLRLQPGGLWSRRNWFPKQMFRGNVESLAFARRHQRVMYRGWFDEWSQDWIPVLLPGGPEREAMGDSTDSPKAVLLYRRVSAEAPEPSPAVGHIVLTTMFIASSEQTALIDNILDLTHVVEHR